jgi:hypothetical protein
VCKFYYILIVITIPETKWKYAFRKLVVDKVKGDDMNSNGQVILRQSIEAAIESLGGPIHKTITWYMNSRGVLSDPKKVDINSFYSNLRELLGPGADMIMEETWEHLQKHYGAKATNDKRPPIEKIQKMMEIGEA